MPERIRTVPPTGERSADLKTAEGDAVAADYAAYLADESRYGDGSAERLVFAKTEADIAAVLSECAASATPVTVSAARTGIVGGAVPFGGVVLSTEAMKTVGEVTGSGDGAEAAVTVGPGVTIDELAERLAGTGYFYPPDPTERTATIGATVATNASGARTYAYGPTREFVRAARVVLACGEVLALSRGGGPRFDADGRLEVELASGEVVELALPGYEQPEVKNVAGYYVRPGMELLDLFIGSEGTLGVLSQVELGLAPEPEGVLTCLAFTSDEAGALSLTEALRAHEPGALAIEYFDSRALALLRRKREADGPGSEVPELPGGAGGAEGAGAALSFEFAYASEDELDGLAAELEALLPSHGSSMDDTWAAFDADEAERIKAFRHAVPEAVNSAIAERKRTDASLYKVGTDMAVPAAGLAEMLAFQSAKLAEGGFEHVVFGHIGDGHLHVNILPSDAAELARAKELYMELARKAVELGGTVAAEHGIGKIKHAFLEMMYGAGAVEEMRAVKRSLDPAGILGRGNIFEWK